MECVPSLSSARVRCLSLLLACLPFLLFVGTGCTDNESPTSSEQVAASIEAGKLAPPRAIPPFAVPPPRDDRDAEMLGYILSGELLCPDYLYDIISRDLAAIRENFAADYPALEHTHVRGPYEPHAHGLYVEVDAATLAAIEQGDYHAWDGLNSMYNADTEGGFANVVTVLLPENLNPIALSNAYSRLPGVSYVWYISGYWDWVENTICAKPTLSDDLGEFDLRTRAESGMTYLFWNGSWFCINGCMVNEWWYFQVDSDGNITFSDYAEYPSWPENPSPAWWPDAMSTVRATWGGWAPH